MQKLLSDQGLIYLPNTTAQFQARIAEETARWAQLITENKLSWISRVRGFPATTSP